MERERKIARDMEGKGEQELGDYVEECARQPSLFIVARMVEFASC